MTHFTKLVRLAAVAGVIVPLLLILTGCETAEGTATMGHVYHANAALASNPQQAAAWGLLGAVAGASAEMQHDKEVAEAGRTQITINNAGNSSVSTSSPADGAIREVSNDRVSNGRLYSGTQKF